ncbi:hypothetical protein JW824_05055 [bacterium]|nr:hypothetical protein [bacterium]
MGKSDEEKFCKKCFDGFIRNKLHIEGKANWEEVLKTEDEPPDYFLYIENHKYAVEITSTQVMLESLLSHQPVRQHTYRFSCIRLINEIKRKAISDNLLKGKYFVTFHAPLTGDNYIKEKKKLRNSILEYVKKTRCHSSYKSEGIIQDGKVVCIILKYNNLTNDISEVFTGIKWIYSSNNVDEVYQILKHAIDDKINKFEKKAKPETSPKILLLLNTYEFADEKLYRNCILKITNYNFFHTIFIVWLSGDGFLLHSSKFL